MVNVVGVPFAVRRVVGDHAHQTVHALTHVNLEKQVKFDEIYVVDCADTEVVPVDDVPFEEVVEGSLCAPDISENPQFHVRELYHQFLTPARKAKNALPRHHILIGVVKGHFVAETDICVEAPGDTPLAGGVKNPAFVSKGLHLGPVAKFVLNFLG